MDARPTFTEWLRANAALERAERRYPRGDARLAPYQDRVAAASVADTTAVYALYGRARYYRPGHFNYHRSLSGRVFLELTAR
jgi:hypothetical protein